METGLFFGHLSNEVDVARAVCMPDLLLMFPFMLASILHYVHQDPSSPSSQAKERPESEEEGFELVEFRKFVMMDPHTTIAVGLLGRMADFHDAEDKLQCLLMALVLLSHTHQDADSLLPALEQAVRGVDRMRLIRDIQCMESGWACSAFGPEAYALTMLCAATSFSKNVEN